MKINNLQVKQVQTIVKTGLFSLVVATILGLALPTQARMSAQSYALPEIEYKTRIVHSKEILGGLYRSKAAHSLRELETVSSLHRYVFRRVYSSLPVNFRSEAFGLTKAIIEGSIKHHMDPLFVLAVIQTESSFRPTIRGSAGEIGLMQIKPDTAAWLTGESIPAMSKALQSTGRNVEIGIGYISKLRKNFPGKAKLYVAAYNMGAAKVRSKVQTTGTPVIYYSRVIANYMTLSKEMMQEISNKEAKEAVKTVLYSLNTTSPANQ